MIKIIPVDFNTHTVCIRFKEIILIEDWQMCHICHDYNEQCKMVGYTTEEINTIAKQISRKQKLERICSNM